MIGIVRYAGTTIDLPRVEFPNGGWVDLDVTWTGADNSLLALDALTVSVDEVDVERLSERRWRLTAPTGTHRVAVYGTHDGTTQQVAAIVIARKRS